MGIVNNKLSSVLTTPGQQRQRVKEIAELVDHEYTKADIFRGTALNLHYQKQTFDQLRKLLQFFEFYQQTPPALENALRIQEDLGIIPLSNQAVASQVSSLDECVKKNLGQIILAT